MKVFELTNSTGYFNVEPRTDGKAHICAQPHDGVVQVTLSKEELMQFAIWLSSHLNNVYGMTKDME